MSYLKPKVVLNTIHGNKLEFTKNVCIVFKDALKSILNEPQGCISVRDYLT